MVRLSALQVHEVHSLKPERADMITHEALLLLQVPVEVHNRAT
jgi:hypothetical protein